MDTDEHGYLNSLTEKVLGAVFEVSNTLGVGFLEKVYERALLKELNMRGIRASSQKSFAVTYKGHSVGEYFADIIVEDVLVIELKCVERLANEHLAQCLNYVRASGMPICLLINFQKPKVEWKRVISDLCSSASICG
jgi:GxxExxY protein